MTNNIDKQSFGEAGCEIITGTSGTPVAPPAGEYCAISFVTDSTISTAAAAAEAPLFGGTETGITYPAGFTIYTPLVIGSAPQMRFVGTVILYKSL